MRYITKFTNSYWKTFDTEEYKDVQLHYLLKDAITFCKNLNEKINKVSK